MISSILIGLSILVLIPISVFALQCFLSFFAEKQSHLQNLDEKARPRLAVLIPAHNEEDSITGILEDVGGQLRSGDRMVVIADNCNDATAEIAAGHGAEVINRNNQDQLGKAYALKFALEHLAQDAPDVVIVVDADCRIASNTLTALAAKVEELDSPVQGSYNFGGLAGSSSSNLASSLTLRFKNHIRPLGASTIGMPYQLTGSGMAFPWHVFDLVDVANGALAEDTELGVHLALAGYPPMFCPAAKIDGNVPKKWGTHVQQRRRWEQGYLQTIIANVPRLFAKGLAPFRPSLLWCAFDMCIPPLALLGLIWAVLFVAATLCGALGGSWLPAGILTAGALMMGLSIVLGWFVHCRHLISFKTLLSIPFFVIRKMSIYASLISKPQSVWLRTERD